MWQFFYQVTLIWLCKLIFLTYYFLKQIIVRYTRRVYICLINLIDWLISLTGFLFGSVRWQFFVESLFFYLNLLLYFQNCNDEKRFLYFGTCVTLPFWRGVLNSLCPSLSFSRSLSLPLVEFAGCDPNEKDGRIERDQVRK